MAQNAGLNIQKNISIYDETFVAYRELLDVYEIKRGAEEIWNRISLCDKKIQETEPFKLIKTDEKKAKEILTELVNELWNIELMLRPFLPETAEKIYAILKKPSEPIIPLFPRII